MCGGGRSGSCHPGLATGLRTATWPLVVNVSNPKGHGLGRWRLKGPFEPNLTHDSLQPKDACPASASQTHPSRLCLVPARVCPRARAAGRLEGVWLPWSRGHRPRLACVPAEALQNRSRVSKLGRSLVSATP